MHKKPRVVITGIGPIASPGIGKNNFWKSVCSGAQAPTKVVKKIEGTLWEQYYFYQVQDFNINNFGISPTSLEEISRWKDGLSNKDLFFLLAAVKLALDDAKINFTDKDNELGVVVCHENPGLEQLLWEVLNLTFEKVGHQKRIETKKEFFKKVYLKVMKTAYEAQSFMTTFHIAKTFNAHNFSLFVNNACSSGAYALDLASDIVKLGKAKKVIVAAADCPDIFKQIWFKEINMYAKDGVIKPFSKKANGLVLGECSAALVLEAYDDATARKANIYAEYLGGGFKLESWGVTTPRIGYDFYNDAIELSLRSSDVKKSQIDLICAHGVGTQISDYYEARAFNKVFADFKIPVTAFKPFVGHCLGASNLIEIIILLMSIKEQVQIPVMTSDKTSLRQDINLAIEKKRLHIEYALKTCSAFAGFVSSSVFKKFS